MNQSTLRILGVVACGIVLAMSILLGGTAWIMSGAMVDGAYDLVRDDRATPDEAVATAKRLPIIEGVAAVFGVASSCGLFGLLRWRPSVATAYISLQEARIRMHVKQISEIRCAKCEAPGIVPIVSGSWDSRKFTLAWQEKVVFFCSTLGSSLFPLWICVDCYTEPSNDQLRMDEALSQQVHHRVVSKLYSEFVEPSDEEYERLRSLRTLKAIAKRVFRRNATSVAIVAASPGIEVITTVNGQQSRENAFDPIERIFDELLACARSIPLQTLRVRVQGKEHEARLSIGDYEDGSGQQIVIRPA